MVIKREDFKRVCEVCKLDCKPEDIRMAYITVLKLGEYKLYVYFKDKDNDVIHRKFEKILTISELRRTYQIHFEDIVW